MRKQIHAAPTLVYPESDGEPMAETDLHRKLMMDFILMLEDHFSNAKDVYVSGNLRMYYEEGNIYKSVAPDVFVVFGVSKKNRRTYRTWEEGKTPDFVLEAASPSTYNKDITEKKELYASVLQVEEYYIYDPYGEVHPHFQGYRLIGGIYQPIEFRERRLPSTVLDLELGERDGTLGLYDTSLSAWISPPKARVAEAEARAVQEAEARKQAEAELVKALEIIKQLEKNPKTQ